MSIEQAAYKVLLKEGNFEIRQYEPMIVAVSQEEDLKGGGGFDKLFGYISGNNQDKRKVDMTTPVLNNLDMQNLTISFVMPKEHSMDTLPKPMDSSVQLKEIPVRQVAVITFSGGINPVKIDEKKKELLDWLKEKPVTITGLVELARYNPPFVPGFIRHNEIMVEVHLDA
jgi:hypothetical protein